MAGRAVHPVVLRTLDVAREVIELLRAAEEQAAAVQFGARHGDGEIAVRVDDRGTLTEVWLRPGVMDRRRPAEIAAEINVLLGTLAGSGAHQARHILAEAMNSVRGLVAELPADSAYFPLDRPAGDGDDPA